jgi:predicted lipoprotein with Yx(FWY)xxD motif
VTKKIYALALLAAIAALVVAGCGGGSGSTSSEASSETSSGKSAEAGAKEAASKPVTAPPNAEEGTTFVSLGNVAGLGLVLVDSKGMTLYDFHKDKGTTSTCYGECATAWPPLLTEGAPQPSNGASAAKLGTIERKDGSMQVTYDGHPLYGFIGDKKPGEANGNDTTAFGAQWYALEGSGEEPEDSGSSDESSDDSGATTSGGTTTDDSSTPAYSGY